MHRVSPVAGRRHDSAGCQACHPLVAQQRGAGHRCRGFGQDTAGAFVPWWFPFPPGNLARPGQGEPPRPSRPPGLRSVVVLCPKKKRAAPFRSRPWHTWIQGSELSADDRE